MATSNPDQGTINISVDAITFVSEEESESLFDAAFESFINDPDAEGMQDASESSAEAPSISDAAAATSFGESNIIDLSSDTGAAAEHDTVTAEQPTRNAKKPGESSRNRQEHSRSASPPSIPTPVHDENFKHKVWQTAQECAEIMPTWQDRLAAMSKKEREKIQKTLNSMNDEERMRAIEDYTAEYAADWESHKELFSQSSVHLANLERNEVEAAAYRKAHEQPKDMQEEARSQPASASRTVEQLEVTSKAPKRKRQSATGEQPTKKKPRAAAILQAIAQVNQRLTTQPPSVPQVLQQPHQYNAHHFAPTTCAWQNPQRTPMTAYTRPSFESPARLPTIQPQHPLLPMNSTATMPRPYQRETQIWQMCAGMTAEQRLLFAERVRQEIIMRQQMQQVAQMYESGMGF